MNLRADEKELVGKWIFDGKTMHGDEIANRIHHLTEQVLKKVAVSRSHGGWETIFSDPQDGRLWERTYPRGEMQGGGPPRLATISEADARTKHDFA